MIKRIFKSILGIHEGIFDAILTALAGIAGLIETAAMIVLCGLIAASPVIIAVVVLYFLAQCAGIV